MSGDAPTEKEARNQWGKGSVAPGGRVPELFAKYPNLYGDLSANSAGQAILRDPAFGLEFLETYADRLFFATDMVNAGMTFPLAHGWTNRLPRVHSAHKPIKKSAMETLSAFSGVTLEDFNHGTSYAHPSQDAEQ